MKKLFKRLRERRGESLVESMAAILIFTMASVVLLTLSASAFRINRAVSEADKANQDQMLIAEQANDSRFRTTGNVKLYLDPDLAPICNIPVDVYQWKPGADEEPDPNAFYAYFRQQGGAN